MAEKTLAERDAETAEIIKGALARGTPREVRAFTEGVLLGALSGLGYGKTVEAFYARYRNGFEPSPQPERTDE